MNDIIFDVKPHAVDAKNNNSSETLEWLCSVHWQHIALHFSGFTVREHRLQRKSTDVTNSTIEDQVDSVDPRIERDIKELSKLPDSGTAKVFLDDLRKIKTGGTMMDPRSASRVPSAANEPPYKTRYESSVFACKCLTFQHKVISY